MVAAVCVGLASCGRTSNEPRPAGTLEPRITESSPLPTPDKDNVACTLLTAEERFALVGYEMNAELPVRPDPGTEECIWVRSLNRPSRSAIRVVAFSTLIWSRQIVPQLKTAIASASTGRTLRAELKKAMNELIANPDGLPSARACETYVLLAKSRGADLGVDQVGYGRIGALPAAFALACEDGIMTMAGYGEYGVRPSLGLNRGATRLVEAASARAAEAFGAAGGEAAGTDEEANAPSAEDGDPDNEARSPSPEAPPAEVDGSDDEEPDDS